MAWQGFMGKLMTMRGEEGEDLTATDAAGSDDCRCGSENPVAGCYGAW